MRVCVFSCTGLSVCLSVCLTVLWSGSDRCALITSYQPYGRSQSGQVVGNAERLLKAGKLDGEDKAKLRQLIGWRLGIGPDGYDQPGYHLRHPTPDNR